jgi:energy-coupling factor transport system permease protein
VSPVPALALLGAVVAAALLAHHIWSPVALVAVLLVVCARAPARRRRMYVYGTAVASVSLFVITPFVETIGSHSLWSGPIVPVVGPLDVTREELAGAAFQAARLAAVGLAFAVYALLLDHDRLIGAFASRRFALGVVLATRLVPTLERDAAAMTDALRGRGVHVTGARGYARLLSPLLAGSLERSLNLAEAMEARGYGCPGRTRLPGPRPSRLDRVAVAAAPLLVVAGALWL